MIILIILLSLFIQVAFSQEIWGDMKENVFGTDAFHALVLIAGTENQITNS